VQDPNQTKGTSGENLFSKRQYRWAAGELDEHHYRAVGFCGLST
jgi:hypothetical protein